MIGLLWIFFERFGLTVLSVIATFWYAKLLGPEGYGYAAILLAAPMMVSGLIDQIHQSSLIANVRTNPSVYLISIKYWTKVSFLISFILYFIMSSVIETVSSVMLILAIAHIPVSSFSKVFVVDLILSSDYKALALRSFVGKFSGLLVGLILAYFGYPIYAILCQSFIGLLVSLFVMLFNIRGKDFFHNLDCSILSWNTFFQVAKDGVPSGVNLLEQSSRSHGLVLLLGITLGPYASGVYSLSNKIVDLVRVNLGHGFIKWSYGQFNSVLEDKNRLVDTFRLTFTISSAVMIPSYIGLSIISPMMIDVVIGSEWKDAYWVVQYLSYIYAIMTIYLFLPSLQVLKKRTYNTLFVGISSTFSMLLFVALCSTKFGLLTPIYGMIVSCLIVIYKYTYELCDILVMKFRDIIKISLPAFACSLIMFLCVGVVELNLPLVIVSSILIYLLSYLSLLFLLEDRKLILKFLSSK